MALALTKPRLLFLNRCYWPDSEATGQLLTDLCEGLASDFDVHVICGQPNSPTTGDFVRAGIQSRHQVTIHRLAHTSFAKRVPAGRLINLLTFTRASDRYLRRSGFPSDVVISETDPFLLPIVAAKHCQRVGARLVCYLQDLYPDVAEALGKVRSGHLTQRIRRGLRDAYLAADRVIVLGRCMRQRLESDPWAIDPARISVIPNWADCQAIRPLEHPVNEFRQREGLQDQFVVMHSGNMGLTQRLDVLLDATLSKKWPQHAVLLLIGDGADRARLESRASSVPAGRVRFLPYQPRQELPASLSAADLHVVSMDERITGCLCPSKLYGILAAGRPVLVIAAKATEPYQTVARHRLGWCCHPGDCEAIAEAVRFASEHGRERTEAGSRARVIACREFDRSRILEQFKEMILNTLDYAGPANVSCES
jgi:glycosyltransferase involved in cell wall biosynthesis